MNLLCLNSNVQDYEDFLSLKTIEGVFGCKVKFTSRLFPEAEISDENLIKLRDFLNEVIYIKKEDLIK